VGILGIGSSLPERVLTNFDLEKMVDTSDEWITKRTGISERRILEKEKAAYELGACAAIKAIEDAGIRPSDIGVVLATTSTPDYLVPSTACLIQEKTGAANAAAFDLNAACTGFVYGLTVAKQFILTGFCKYVLVVACEALSKVVDWKDRNTCVLFGDGAGAFVLGPAEKGFGILDSYLKSDGSQGRVITLPCCHMEEEDIAKRAGKAKNVLWMDGSEVFKFAVKAVTDAIDGLLEKAHIKLEELNLIIPHQANIRIIDGAAKRLKLPDEKIYTNIHKYGNISSASIPVAVEEVVRAKRVKKGDYLLFVAFGGGLTWGSTLVRWNR
jgi:3-oxoacyl-[acyl-carrier-protein] synthase-3